MFFYLRIQQEQKISLLKIGTILKILFSKEYPSLFYCHVLLHTVYTQLVIF